MKRQLFLLMALVALPASSLMAQVSNSSSTIQNSSEVQESPVCWNITTIDADKSNAYQVLSDISVFNNGQTYIYRSNNATLWKSELGNRSFHAAPITTGYKAIGDFAAVQDGNLIFFVSQDGITSIHEGQYQSVLKTAKPITTLAASADGLNLYYQQEGQIWNAQRANINSTDWTMSMVWDECIGDKIIVHPHNTQNIFFRASGNQLVNATKTERGWYVANIADGVQVSSNFALSPQGNEIFLTNTENHLMHLVADNKGTWNHDYFLANYHSHDNEVAIVDNIASDIQIADNPRKIFYIGDDNSVWNIFELGVWRASSLNCKVSNASHGLVINEPTGGSISFVNNTGKITTEQWGICEDVSPDCNAQVQDNESTTDKDENNSIMNSTESIMVYPNPANDWVHVVSTFENPISEISIYNSFGQLIKTVKYDESRDVQLDMSSLTPGAYLLRINSMGALTTKNIIKM